MKEHSRHRRAGLEGHQHEQCKNMEVSKNGMKWLQIPLDSSQSPRAYTLASHTHGGEAPKCRFIGGRDRYGRPSRPWPKL